MENERHCRIKMTQRISPNCVGFSSLSLSICSASSYCWDFNREEKNEEEEKRTGRMFTAMPPPLAVSSGRIAAIYNPIRCVFLSLIKYRQPVRVEGRRITIYSNVIKVKKTKSVLSKSRIHLFIPFK